MNASDFVRYIDHTLLKPEATTDQIDRLCDEAMEHRFYCVCVNPVFVEQAVRKVESSDTIVASVAGFPLGATIPSTLVEESRRCVEAGAHEIDMVIWVGGLIDGERERIVETIRAVASVVHRAGPGHLLKAILEASALTEDQMILGCRCVAEGEADFVKTSTGFHPSGGATVEQVRLLHRHASPLKVKAAGGIRDVDTALKMIEAGASRLGTSAAVSIVRELAQRDP